MLFVLISILIKFTFKIKSCCISIRPITSISVDSMTDFCTRLISMSINNKEIPIYLSYSFMPPSHPFRTCVSTLFIQPYLWCIGKFETIDDDVYQQRCVRTIEYPSLADFQNLYIRPFSVRKKHTYVCWARQTKSEDTVFIKMESFLLAMCVKYQSSPCPREARPQIEKNCAKTTYCISSETWNNC